MKRTFFISVFTTLVLFLTGINVSAQNAKKELANKPLIEVIQFHSEHRCVTCNLIEKLTREAIKTNSDVTFKLVNVDDKKNDKLAEQFEASGTALFLYNPKTGKKKDLTDFAFMNARNNAEKFKETVNKEIKNLK